MLARRSGLPTLLALVLTASASGAQPREGDRIERGSADRLRSPVRGPVRVSVRYTVRTKARGCLTEPRFLDEVARRVSSDVLDAEAQTTVAVTIGDEGRGLRAQIELVEAAVPMTESGGTGSREKSEPTPNNGQRTFSDQINARADECGALGAASAHVVALAIERLQEERSRATADRPAPAPPAALPAEPNGARTEAVSISTERPAKGNGREVLPHRQASFVGPARPWLATVARVGISRGYIPAVTAGSSIGASVGTHGTRTWLLTADLGLWWPTRIVAQSGGTARVSFSSWTLAGCARAAILFGCATMALVDLRAVGEDLPSQTTRALLGSFGARAGAIIPLQPPFGLELFVGAAVPTSRVVVRADEQQLWRAPAFAVDAGFGVRMQIH